MKTSRATGFFIPRGVSSRMMFFARIQKLPYGVHPRTKSKVKQKDYSLYSALHAK